MQEKVLLSFDGKFMLYTPYGSKEDWKDARIYLFNDGTLVINYYQREIKFKIKNLEPVDEKIPSSITGLVTMFETYKLRLREKTSYLLIHGDKKYIKRLTRYICYFNLMNTICYILYPYMIGGAIQKNVKWRKSTLLIKLKRTPGKVLEIIAFKYNGSLVTIPLERVIDFKKDKINIQNREVEVLSVKFLNEKSVSFVILIYTFDLNLLYKIFESYFDEYDIKREEIQEEEFEDVKLSDIEEQVLYALYSGINSLEVHSLLGIDVNEIEKIYDKLIDMGLLKLVRLRKEVELTGKGKYLVEKIMKEKGTKL